MRDYLMVAVVAATTGTLLAPFIRRTAIRAGFVDRPDGRHKRHNEPVPLGGGLLIFLGTIVALGAVAVVSPVVRLLVARDAALAVGFLLSSLLLIVIGTIDDRRGMRGRHKLVGQIAAALVLTSQGLEIRQLELLGWVIDLGVMSVPFTVFWLLGAINALNLLDGIDGLAGLVGLVTSLLVACVAIISGQAFAALMAIAVAGACLAFLHVNFPPAKMFLGDTGSMLLGLFLGGLVIVGCSSGPGLLSLAPAVALLALPILDAGVALLRRRLTGRSIYMTDRGHLHHCLLHELESHYAVLLVAATACLASGVGAALSVFAKNDVTALVCSTLVVLVLILLRLFGHVECLLLLSKLAAPAVRIARRSSASKNGRHARTVAVQLQGDRQWRLLWESLTEWAEKLQLQRIVLDVNLPAMREGFHADWYQTTQREKHECWQMEIPLFMEGTAVGRLQVAGDRSDSAGSVCEAVDRLVELLEPFEKAFAALAASPTDQEGRADLQALKDSAARPAAARIKRIESPVASAPAEVAGLGIR